MKVMGMAGQGCPRESPSARCQEATEGAPSRCRQRALQEPRLQLRVPGTRGTGNPDPTPLSGTGDVYPPTLESPTQPGVPVHPTPPPQPSGSLPGGLYSHLNYISHRLPLNSFPPGLPTSIS